MTFDETIAALRAGKCVSRPNDNSYLVIEEKILTKHYKDEPCIVCSGETIPCGGPELTGADIGYEVYRPRAIVSEEDMVFLNEAYSKACDASRGEAVSSVSVRKEMGDGRNYLYLSVSGGTVGEWRVWIPTGVVLAGMIRGFAYRPDEITTKGEKNRNDIREIL